MPLAAVAISLLGAKAASKYGAHINFTIGILLWNVLVLIIGGALAITDSKEPRLLTGASVLVAFLSVAVYAYLRLEDVSHHEQIPSFW